MRLGGIWRLPAAALMTVFLLAACGGDGGEGGSDRGDGGDAAAAGECGGSGGIELAISADKKAFDKAELSAPAGEQVTVRFENKDMNVGPSAVTAVPHTFTVSNLDCDTGNVQGGATAELSFTFPDTETEYVCTIHPTMKGTLVPE